MAESYKSVGYILPIGDAYTEEYECCFVFVPAKDEYRRALFGSLDYLGTWLAWEKESEHRAKDAARAWKLANDLTRECWQMGTCQDISDKLTALIALMALPHCCDGEGTSTTYVDNRTYTTTIVPGSGDAPDYYGETAVSDWDEWKEYVCFNAHAYVDSLVQTAERIDNLLDIGIFTLEALTFQMSYLLYVYYAIAPPINIPYLGAIWKAIINAGYGYFDAVAQQLEDSREDIVCALIDGSSLGDAVESAIGGSLAWTLLYSHLDYETVQAIIYEGGNDIGYLPAERRDDCLCLPPLEPGQLVQNPDFVYGWAAWNVTVPPWKLSLSGQHVSYVDNIEDTLATQFYSDQFTIPSGYGHIQAQVRAYNNATRDSTWVVVLRDSGGNQIGSWSGVWNGHNNTYTTAMLGIPIAVTAGQNYYVQVYVLSNYANYVYAVDFVKIWATE